MLTNEAKQLKKDYIAAIVRTQPYADWPQEAKEALRMYYTSIMQRETKAARREGVIQAVNETIDNPFPDVTEL